MTYRETFEYHKSAACSSYRVGDGVRHFWRPQVARVVIYICDVSDLLGHGSHLPGFVGGSSYFYRPPKAACFSGALDGLHFFVGARVAVRIPSKRECNHDGERIENKKGLGSSATQQTKVPSTITHCLPSQPHYTIHKSRKEQELPGSHVPSLLSFIYLLSPFTIPFFFLLLIFLLFLLMLYRYVIFPVQVLAKSCKPVPVMLMGALRGKKYPMQKVRNEVQ